MLSEERRDDWYDKFDDDGHYIADDMECYPASSRLSARIRAKRDAEGGFCILWGEAALWDEVM